MQPQKDLTLSQHKASLVPKHFPPIRESLEIMPSCTPGRCLCCTCAACSPQKAVSCGRHLHHTCPAKIICKVRFRCISAGMHTLHLALRSHQTQRGSSLGQVGRAVSLAASPLLPVGMVFVVLSGHVWAAL